MKFEQIISDLKNKIYHPIYFLSGEEPYYIDIIADYIAANVLDDSEKEFNQSIVYGKELDVSAIVGMAKRFPMMSDYQVLIVKEAQTITKIEEFEAYFEKPLKSTILVLCYKYKTLDKRKKIAKTIDKNAVLFESSKLYEDKIPDWISTYLRQKNYKINPVATQLLSEFLGNDLTKIVNEISKLVINLPEHTEITVDHIEKNIGISKDFNVFELQNALGRKDVFKANQIINYFAANPKDNSIVMVIALLYAYFSKLLVYQSIPDKSQNNVASVLGIKPFFVSNYANTARNYPTSKLRNIISILREYDSKAKGIDSSDLPDGELLKELIYKILH